MEEKMKKQRLGMAALGIASVMAIMLVSGCGIEKTMEVTIKDILNNLQSQKSLTAVFKMEMHLGEGDEEAFTTVKMELENTAEPEVSHGNGSVDIETDGTTLTTEIERYLLKEDRKYVSYALDEGGWRKSELNVEGQNAAIGSLLSGLKEYEDKFQLIEGKSEVNGQDCFQLEGTLNADTLENIAQLNLAEIFSGYGIDEKEIDNLVFPCVLDVYQENNLPARIYLDMEENLATMLKETGVPVGECYAELTSMEYNNVDEIAVPNDVISGSESNGDEADYSVIPAKPVDINPDLGENWNSYNVQINEKVIALPCTVEKLNAAGLTLNQEDMPEDFKISANESQIAAFKDAAGNEIMAEIFNSANTEMSLDDCMIVSISVNSADIRQGGLTVLLPGGIQIGSSEEEVLATYGEPAEMYKDEEYGNTYSWYEEGSYYSGCIVDLEGGSGLIESMSIKNQE